MTVGKVPYRRTQNGQLRIEQLASEHPDPQLQMHDENGAARGGVSRRRGGVPQLRFPQGGAGNRSRVTDGKRQNIRK